MGMSLLVSAGSATGNEVAAAATPPNELPLEWHDFTGDGKSDLVAREQSTGNVYVFRHSGRVNGSLTFDQKILVLQGAQNFTWMGVNDVTGDSIADLVARLSDGTLVTYPGVGGLNGLGTFEPAVVVGSGWNIVNQIQLSDVTGDGYADISGVWSTTGELFVWPSTGLFDGVNTWGPKELIGTGWNAYNWVGSNEATSDDEKPDLVGRKASDGTLQLYPHQQFYDGTKTYVGPVQVGKGYQAVQPVTMTDLSLDGFPDIIAKRGGDLIFYPNAGGYDGDNTFRAPITLGTTWSGMDLVA